MGGGVKGSDEDRSNGMGTDDDVQCCGSDGATLWERELGSDRVDPEGSGGVPQPGGREDIR